MPLYLRGNFVNGHIPKIREYVLFAYKKSNIPIDTYVYTCYNRINKEGMAG